MPQATHERDFGMSQHEAEKSAQDWFQTVAGANIVMRNFAQELANRIADYDRQVQRGLENGPAINLDKSRPTTLTIRVDGEEVYKGFQGKDPEVNTLNADDYQYIQKALQLSKGQAPPEFNRDLEIKANGKTVFEMRNGEVLTNKLTPQMQQSLGIEVGKRIPSQQQAKPQAQSSDDTEVVLDGPQIKREGPQIKDQQPTIKQPPQINMATNDPKVVDQKLMEINDRMGQDVGKGTKAFSSSQYRIYTNPGKNEVRMTDKKGDLLYHSVNGKAKVNKLNNKQVQQIHQSHKRLVQGKSVQKKRGISK